MAGLRVAKGFYYHSETIAFCALLNWLDDTTPAWRSCDVSRYGLRARMQLVHVLSAQLGLEMTCLSRILNSVETTRTQYAVGRRRACNAREVRFAGLDGTCK
jgi:hypothetical protein